MAKPKKTKGNHQTKSSTKKGKSLSNVDASDSEPEINSQDLLSDDSDSEKEKRIKSRVKKSHRATQSLQHKTKFSADSDSEPETEKESEISISSDEESTITKRRGKKANQKSEVDNSNSNQRRARKSTREDVPKKEVRRGRKSINRAAKVHGNDKIYVVENNDINNENRIISIRTTHTGAFKQAMEKISNVVSDCCLTFLRKIDDDEDDTNRQNHTPDEKKGGIRIYRLTEEKNILIRLLLYAKAFDFFYCEKNKITAGIEMSSFTIFLKSISDESSLEIYMLRHYPSSLFFAGSRDDNNIVILEVNIQDIAESDIPIDKKEFDQKIIIPAEKFHGICKSMYSNTNYVELIALHNEITFNGKNDNGKISIVYQDPTVNPDKRKNKKKEIIFRAVYELRSIMNFSKCNKMCQEVRLYFKNEFPLVIAIPVAEVGKMYVFISHIEPPD